MGSFVPGVIKRMGLDSFGAGLILGRLGAKRDKRMCLAEFGEHGESFGVR
jgi:hypothetical protein